jgi:nucleoside phosphorylase
MAMMEEATPVIQALNLTRCHTNLNPYLCLLSFTGFIANRQIYLIVNGEDPDHHVARVGTEAAALCAYEVISSLKPDTLISAGTAGGYAERGAQLGDVYIASDEFNFHDRRITLSPAYEAYARGHYPCLETHAIASSLNLKMGRISSGNSLSISPEDQAMIDALGSNAKEMEVAAIAHVARFFNVRVCAVKAITNIAGIEANAAEQFQTHFTLATQALARTLPGIIEHLLHPRPSALNPITKINPWETPTSQKQHSKNSNNFDKLSADRPIEKLAILVAMPEEAHFLIQELKLKRHDLGLNPNLGLETYSGRCGQREIYCIINGTDYQHGVARVGTEAASLSAYEVITCLNPDTLISAGTAGGYAERGAKIGDVYLSTGKFYFHDRHIPLSPNYEAYSRGAYASLALDGLAHALNLKQGIVSSGNSLELSPSEAMTLLELKTDVKDMEAAAIAQVSRLFGVRVLAVKAITDLIGETSSAANQFEANFAIACKELSLTMKHIIPSLLGYRPSELEEFNQTDMYSHSAFGYD